MQTDNFEVEPRFQLMSIIKVLREKYLFILFLTFIFASIGVIYTFLKKPEYKATSEIVIGRQLSSELENNDGYQYETRQFDTIVETELRVLDSIPLKEKVLAELQLEDKLPVVDITDPQEQDKYYRELIFDQFQLSRIPNSRVILISAFSPYPELAAAMANGMVDAYIVNRRELRFKSIKESLDWLKNEIDSLKEKVIDSEEQLLRFVEQNDIGYLYSSQDAGGEQTASHPAMSALETLDEKKILAELELAEKEVILLADHPEIQELKSYINRLNNKIVQVKRQLRRDHELRIKYQMLQREADLNNDFFSVLMREMKTKDIIGEIPHSQVTVIQKAEIPDEPDSPNIKLNLILSLVLGLFLAVLVTAFIESLDTSLRSEEDVSKLLDSKLLASFPRRKKSAENGFDNYLHDFKSQNRGPSEFRLLWSNIQFMKFYGPIKSLLITSASPLEGKTTIACNLALASADSGKKTLLIDHDLFRPIIARVFALNGNHQAINDFLFENTDNIDDVLTPSGYDNLWLAAARPSDENLFEILNSGRIEQFIKLAKNEFDQIFIDSPPINHFPDANIIASHADSVLFVTQEKGLSHRKLKAAIDQLKEINKNFLGVVYNKSAALEDKWFGYYSYRYDKRSKN